MLLNRSWLYIKSKSQTSKINLPHCCCWQELCASESQNCERPRAPNHVPRLRKATLSSLMHSIVIWTLGSIDCEGLKVWDCFCSATDWQSSGQLLWRHSSFIFQAYSEPLLCSAAMRLQLRENEIVIRSDSYFNCKDGREETWMSRSRGKVKLRKQKQVTF